jgi:hypothetical protein
MNDRDSAHDDVFQRMANLTDRAGIDTDQAGKINEGALDWLQSVVDQAKAMKLEAKKSVECPECAKRFHVEFFDLEKATKAATNISKLLDVNARLTQFIQGKEDSRPGGRGGDHTILQCLKPDQLAILQSWLLENQAVQG